MYKSAAGRRPYFHYGEYLSPSPLPAAPAATANRASGSGMDQGS